jgi:hypothetical protein
MALLSILFSQACLLGQNNLRCFRGDKAAGKDDGTHRDGDGYSIVLNALPIDGRIILRPAKTGSSRRE